MNDFESRRFRQLVLVGSLGAIALVTGARIGEYESSPWGWVVAFAIGAAVMFGPVAWVVRDRIPDERRERLSYVVSGVVLLCVPIFLGLGLVVGGLLFFLDVVVLGSIVGLAVVSAVERTAVPERLCAAVR
ncbi:hypothetical protein [Natronobeatus ordinarius]|uniref:hypothetical protein n=1 Tax=Natronobeatus ordinarius TaxID=2963433 RepID=UPI0020CE721F|nr:hypothetical protein [Natronobeatus ordinarius]